MRSAILVLVACGHSSSPTTPPGDDAHDAAIADASPDGAPDATVDDAIEKDFDDVATALGDVLHTPVNIALVDGVNMAFGIPPAGFQNTALGVWSGAHDSVAYTYTYHCENEAGIDTYTCGPGTNHIHWMVGTAGTAAMDTFAMTEVKLMSHWHIRDIDENKPRVEDLGRLLIAGRIVADQARLQLTIDGTWTTVRFDPQPTVPFSGTIAFVVTAHRSRASSIPTDRDFMQPATVTFALNAPATIALDDAHRYALDMTTGAVTRI